jgi:FkbM family methyltransferase
MANPILRYTKRAVAPVLARLGQKLVHLGRPTRNFAEFFEHIKRRGFVPATVLDVGAASGTLPLHDAFPQAHFILIEALAEFEPSLKRLAARYDCEIHLVGAGRVSGTAVLALHEDPYGSFIEEIQTDGTVKGTREIQIQTIEEILDRRPPPRPALAKFDVQGFELEAVDGMGRWLAAFDVVIIETTTTIVCSHPPDLATVVSFMKARGFSVFDILDGILRPFDGDLGQIDLVFVKDDGPFRRDAGRWF